MCKGCSRRANKMYSCLQKRNVKNCFFGCRNRINKTLYNNANNNIFKNKKGIYIC